MDISTQPPGRVIGVARALTGQLLVVPDGVLQAAYLHGSAALGGSVPGRSDVDMLFVAADGISSAAVTRMGEVLRAGAGGCPGRELECSVVTVTQARQPAPAVAVCAARHGPGTRQSRKFRSSYVADASGSVSAAMHAVSRRRI
jgi:hypothetical protein